MTEPARAAVFLDRDGTLITEGHYLADPEGVNLVPGAADALRTLREAGFALVVVTNQSGIAKGLYTLEAYQAVAARLTEVLEERGVVVDATYFCPHDPVVSGACDCRKPGTGMYLRAASELDVDPAGSWYVGDKISDILPAERLGGRGILVRTGYGASTEGETPPGVAVVDDLPAAARHILTVSRGTPAGGKRHGPGGVDPSPGPR